MALSREQIAQRIAQEIKRWVLREFRHWHSHFGCELYSQGH